MQVQGAEAATQICRALAAVNTAQLAEVVIIARGGGSLEDLQAFNDERLLRAIAASVIPVVSAVGHETDFTLCDAVADLRAATPSQAAELVVPSRQELAVGVAALVTTLQRRLTNIFTYERKTVLRLIRHKVLARPQTIFDKRRMELDNKLELLAVNARRLILKKRSSYEIQCEKIAMLNPLAVLQRGFAALSASGGQPVNSITQLIPGAQIVARLADGRFSAKIIKIIPEHDYEKQN